MFKSQGALLKHLIKEKGFTQEEFAVAVGVARQTVTQWLSRTTLPEEHLKKIAAVLHIQVDELKNNDKSSEGLVQEEGIPYYKIDVSASNVDVFNDHPEMEAMRIVIPGFQDCELALPVYGHSMYPTYDSGCIIICKRITDFDIISYGEAHLVITKEQRLLKRVTKGKDDDHLRLESDNVDAKDKHGNLRYGPFEIPKTKVRHLFLVKGSVKRNQI